MNVGGHAMERLECKCGYDNDILTVTLRGSVDHHNVRPVREEIDRALYQCCAKQVVFDMSGIDFMDSSGLGLILGRYTKITDMGGRMTLRGTSEEIMKIIELAGMEKFIPIEGTPRRP